MKTKAGFAVLIGRSNVGKSTLLNALIGSKVAITTPKPQTTRRPIQGIITKNDCQIIFVDTPGVFKDASDLLSKQLHKYVRESLRDIDVILYVVDPTRGIGTEERAALSIIRNLKKPKILVINKSDLKHRPELNAYRDLAKDFSQTFEVSARTHQNLNELISAIMNLLPESEYYYPEGQMTNIPTREWLAELIREKLFLRLRQEVPYSLHVVVDEDQERENGTRYISARVITNAERYQRMIIGAGGRGIKEIGQSTRRELEAVMNTKIYLELNVEVDPHWMEQF